MTHICVGNLTIIGPDNDFSPGRRQAIIWTNAGILLIVPWGTNFSEILLGIQTFSFKKMHLIMSFAKWRPFCLGLNVKVEYMHCKWCRQPWRKTSKMLQLMGYVFNFHAMTISLDQYIYIWYLFHVYNIPYSLCLSHEYWVNIDPMPVKQTQKPKYIGKVITWIRNIWVPFY